IVTGCAVERITVKDDRVSGVALADGREIAAPMVLSNADAKRTYFDLLGVEHLDTGFVRRLSNLRSKGMTAKLDLALDGLPELGVEAALAQRARFVLSPSLRYLERGFDCAKYGEPAEAPALEITLPSLGDPAMAPAGHHV